MFTTSCCALLCVVARAVVIHLQYPPSRHPHSTLPRNHQVLFFSATFTDAVIAYGKDQCTEEPNIIRLALSEVTLDSIRQLWINCGTEAGKYEALTDIYGSLQVSAWGSNV